jgi:AcrR family transcriptional regulator
MATATSRMGSGRTQRERSEATIAELVKAARRLFVEKGYADTTLDAVYHHFSGKRDLFRAVYEREQQSLAEISFTAYRRKRDPKRGFYEACRAFFEASLDPGVQRITLIDAPAALGGDGMRKVADRYSMALIVTGLQTAIDDGLIAKRPVEPLAHLIFGAICEGVMLVARSEDQRAMTRQVLVELKSLFDAF